MFAINFRDAERFVLFIACLCHDGDHRGSTNSFQNFTVNAADCYFLLYDFEFSYFFQNSALAQLYGSSTCLEVNTL